MSTPVVSSITSTFNTNDLILSAATVTNNTYKSTTEAIRQDNAAIQEQLHALNSKIDQSKDKDEIIAQLREEVASLKGQLQVYTTMENMRKMG